jgi:DNA-binding MarR family transcriptional regulator
VVLKNTIPAKPYTYINWHKSPDMFWEISYSPNSVSNPNYQLRFLAPNAACPVDFKPSYFTQIDILSGQLIKCQKEPGGKVEVSIRAGRTPRSTFAIISALICDGPMCPKELSVKLDMAPRTVSFALRKLLSDKILNRIPNLHDMRRPKYYVNIEQAKHLLERYKDTPYISAVSPIAWRKMA